MRSLEKPYSLLIAFLFIMEKEIEEFGFGKTLIEKQVKTLWSE